MFTKGLIAYAITFGLAACLLVGVEGKQMKEDVLQKVDHLVYAAPDLAAGVEQVERLLGVKATTGGQHPRAGTRNALIGLGGQIYLEIIGPDPEQPKPLMPRRFGIDDLKAPRLVTWAARETNIEAVVENAKRQGLEFGQVQSGSRRRPDGVLLSWRTASPAAIEDGLVPFFIDWGKTSHPTTSLTQACRLVALRGEHPNPDVIKAKLSKLGLNAHVDRGPASALIATIQSPNGSVELR